MRKLQLLLVLISFFGFSAFGQSIKCVKGNCENGYGFATMHDASGQEYGYQVGFYKEGKLNGVANQTGTFGKFWGTFKDGKRHGFFSYESDGILYAFGQFVDGKKEGLHVIRTQQGYDYKDYKNDAHVSNSPLASTATAPCVLGNCNDGRGVKINGNDAVYSSWKGGMMNGMTMQFLPSQSKIIFSEYKEGMLNGLHMIWHFDKSAEIMQMKDGQKDGKYLKRKTDSTHEAAIYKAGVLTTSF
ncbi:hypothetical protein BXY85_3930 [Roseivirga pacifica]|uniref:MORN repeat-containing protein n=1 Tax=Roseivirga pacifica TaxID=1267423 RepID=A0A1I0Q265_9BACT|nr:hypothetical protein [Roseivirga pacifica]RKQ43311.1 hypothetical protein BXY85_3930 [Roseivirga pacifica]SEW21040.1 hypothetical protein SAMN05216290_1945 [Roseivirga pacifica]